MIDFRTTLERRKGWWIEERSTVPCILPPDGLLAVFRTQDVLQILNAYYPWFYNDKWGNRHWYFNETKDREIAEQDAERVLANPCVLWDHFLLKHDRLFRKETVYLINL